MNLPAIPCSFESFPSYLETAKSPRAVADVVEPFKAYETKLRQIYAQEPFHAALSQNHLVPVYRDGLTNLKVRARNLTSESDEERAKYILPLSTKERRGHDSIAITPTLRDFKKNFNIFSESSLADLNWDNVVAAGSSVVTALLPVEAPHNESKRALRSYYHEVVAPASDVDLFLYGLDEKEATEKIKQIEAQVRDSILSETTVVRTKHAITIISEYPTRHIQIVLRLYKSAGEILTGFDVDCACVAFDGKQVWAAPRALAAFATQTNSIDLTRRSPSYENRLSKYSHRGFEVYWSHLDRSRVDPTIFERSFNRVLGLARLLVLEKLPHPQDRDEYLTKRRSERGRPELPWNARFRHQLPGNVKDAQPDDVAEWVEEDDISSYHTFAIPYGPRYTPKKIERLLFQQDLLKNAEWNKPKDREANLHRHPAFFGRVEDVIGDCCGYCPKPVTDEDLAVHEEESKIFVSGEISFLKDDPGRQEIGSFRPLTDDDWTEMAYIGNTTRLCQAIVDKDLEAVIDWFGDEHSDVNQRSHTGRTPLQLAVTCSSPEIVECLIDRGARIVARLYNGLTALHLAAWRGSPEIVKLLLDKSAANEADEDAKEEKRKQARREAAGVPKPLDDDVEMTQPEANNNEDEDSDADELMEEDSDTSSEDRMTGSFVKIENVKGSDVEAENEDDPDVYSVDVVAWDSPCSALHLAMMAGHLEVMRMLVEQFGADVMLPVKLMTNHVPREPRAAILTLLLPLDLPFRKAAETIKTLLSLGASPVQADMEQITSLHYIIDGAKTEILKAFNESSPESTAKAINHLVVKSRWREASLEYPLLSAIRSGCTETVKEVLAMGANPAIELEDFVKAYKATKDARNLGSDELKDLYLKSVNQPIIEAARMESMVGIVSDLLQRGVDVNTLSAKSWALVQSPQYRYNSEDVSLLDVIQQQRKKLEEFAKETEPQKKARLEQSEHLQSDEHYLSGQGIEQGTYRSWSASNDLLRARFVQDERQKKFQHDFDSQKAHEPQPGLREQKEAASEMARTYQRLEQRLIEEGAKKFYELYPKLRVEESESTPRNNKGKDFYDNDDLAYRTKFTFYGSDVTPSKQAQYLELFEATFAGDKDKVKQLCLRSSCESGHALQISVHDENGFDPFSIAVLREHYDLASLVLDIAAAQYEDKKETKRMEYSMQPYDGDGNESLSDEDSSTASDDGTPRFFARLVDDKFTIDDINALAENIKSTIKPTDMVNRRCETWRCMSMSRDQALKLCRVNSAFNPEPYIYHHDKGKPWSLFNQCMTAESNRTRFTLWTHSVVTNNVRLLKFLLESEGKYSMKDPDELLKSLDNRQRELTHAMNLGHLEIVDLLLRYRGAFLPLHHLAERSGVVIEEVPKYYQGLSVYGQKRKDWARQDRAEAVDKSETASPLLNAIMEGTLDIIDYFLGDTPARRYEEFCQRFGQDQRIRALAEGKGGIAAALKSWMKIRINLALHIAVMSWPAGANSRLRYLLEKVPAEYLEIRSAKGETPLHLALKLNNLPAFGALLAAGANQRTRDKKGRNLLHTIYEDAQKNNIALFRKKVAMLKQSNITDLVLERCSSTDPGSLTPLSLYLNRNTNDDKGSLPLLDNMLEISKGSDLVVMNGAGDYPLHVEVRRGSLVKAEYLASKQPSLLFRENATGMTPIEVAETRYLQSRMAEPRISHNSHGQSIVDKPARDFIKQDDDMPETSDQVNQLDDDLPLSDPIYSTLLRLARQDPRARHLVSVLDANEVARRLAGQQHRKNAENRRREAQGLKSRWNRYYSRNPESDNEDGETGEPGKQDEVGQWYTNAQGRFRDVPFNIHAEDTPEVIERELAKWNDLAEGKTKVLKCCNKADSDDKYVRMHHRKVGNEIGEVRGI